MKFKMVSKNLDTKEECTEPVDGYYIPSGKREVSGIYHESPETIEEAKKYAESLIMYFNETLRPGESARELLKVYEEELINKILKQFIKLDNNILYQNLNEITESDVVSNLTQLFSDSLEEKVWYKTPYWNYRLSEKSDFGEAVGKFWFRGGNYTKRIEELDGCKYLEYAKQPAKGMGVTCFYCTEENILNLGAELKAIFPASFWTSIKFKYDIDTIKSGKSKFSLNELVTPDIEKTPRYK